MAEIISVISGKGGTGKSTISAGIAVTLAQAGVKVLVVDLDVGLRALDIMLGLENSVVYDIGDLIAGRVNMEKAVVFHKSYSCLRLLSAPISVVDGFDIQRLIAIIQSCKSIYDYIILDLPAGLGLGVIMTKALADLGIVVTTTDPVTMRDARRICDAISRDSKVQLKLIINRVSKETIEAGGVRDLDEVMDNVGIPLLGVFVEDVWIRNYMISDEKQKKKLNKLTKLTFNAVTHRIQGEYVPLVVASL